MVEPIEQHDRRQVRYVGNGIIEGIDADNAQQFSYIQRYSALSSEERNRDFENVRLIDHQLISTTRLIKI